MKYLPLLTKTNYWGELKKAPGKKRHGYIDDLENQVLNKNISAVIGVRRCGKSTILVQLLERLIEKGYTIPKNTLYINFEDPRVFEVLVDNRFFDLISEFNGFCDKRKKRVIVLDEIQNVQNWQGILRILYEQEKNLKIYITGSSSKLLGKELGTKLSGRYLSTEVFPLSYTEFRGFSNYKSVGKYVQKGGFPDAVLAKSETLKSDLLRDYYESILLRDVSVRYGIRRDFKLKRLANTLYTNISNQASSYRLSKELGLTAGTVLQYFEYIENAYLGFFVPKYSVSLRRQEYNPKKFYAIDTALQQAISFRVIDDLGKLFENIVFLELRRRYKDIYYFEEDKETDFIVKTGEHVKYIVNASFDIKNGATKSREIESLKQAMYEFKKEKSYLVVVKGRGEIVKTEAGKINIVNLQDFCEILNNN